MAKDLYSAVQYNKKLKSFKGYLGKIKPSDDYTIVKERLLEALYTLQYYLDDMIMSIDKARISMCQNQKAIIESFINTINISNNANDLEILTLLAESLNEDFTKNLIVWNLEGLAEGLEFSENDSYVMPRAYLDLLRKTINNECINTFFPNCLKGSNVTFCTDNDKAFGQTASHVSRAKEVMHRVAKGGLKGSTITNNYFDAMFIVSKVGYANEVDHVGITKEPNERIEFKNTIKYVRPGGVIFLTLPYTRLLPSFAMYLSKVLSNVQIVRVPNGDALQRVTIIGTKNLSNKNSDKELYQKLKFLNYEKDTISIHDLQQCIYNIPTEELTLEYFRGSELDIDDVMAASNDNMLDNFLSSQTDPLVVKDQAPPLPFNIGQVGLVLTSGCLDGVIEEMDGINHVIKGMTTKVMTTNREELDDNRIKCTETINNQVKINVFTADGKFIQLG